MKRSDEKYFADLKRTLEDIEKFEHQQMSVSLKEALEDMREHGFEGIADVTREIDFDETKVEYVKAYKKEKRNALLNTYVPQRRCVLCDTVKIKSRQWVILPPDVYNRCQAFLRDLNDRPAHDIPDSVILIIRVTLIKRVICRACYRRYIEQWIL